MAAGILAGSVGFLTLLNAQGLLYLLAGLIAARWLTAVGAPSRPTGPHGTQATQLGSTV
jgi:hypothetical protein